MKAIMTGLIHLGTRSIMIYRQFLWIYMIGGTHHYLMHQSTIKGWGESWKLHVLGLNDFLDYFLDYINGFKFGWGLLLYRRDALLVSYNSLPVSVMGSVMVENKGKCVSIYSLAVKYTHILLHLPHRRHSATLGYIYTVLVIPFIVSHICNHPAWLPSKSPSLIY